MRLDDKDAKAQGNLLTSTFSNRRVGSGVCAGRKSPSLYSGEGANNELLWNYSVKTGECGTYLGSNAFFHAFGVEEFIS